MNRKWFGLVLLLWICWGALADDKPNAAPTAAERLTAIQNEHKYSEETFRRAAESLPDTPDGTKKYAELWQMFDKGQARHFLAAVELAKAEPKSATGFAALEWVLTNPRAYQLSAGKSAMELAAAHYADDPKIGKIIAWIGYYPPQEGSPAFTAAKTLFHSVAEKNPDRTARGQAMMAFAWEAKRKFDVAEYRKTGDEVTLAAAAEKAFELIVNDYADCPRLMRAGQRSLGDEARAELFELRNLRIGKAAPEIEGEDLDGVKFRLSDYRGKVVVIDFWGDW